MSPLNSDEKANNGDAPSAAADYYAAGSKEVATNTPLILNRLESRRILTANSSCLVIVLVGLPARGKSFVSRKLQSFLRWKGSQCKIFNVGKYRRQAAASYQKANEKVKQQQDESKKGTTCDASFFDPNNHEAAALRERVAHVALEDVFQWFNGDEDSDSSHEDQPSRSIKRRGSSSSSTNTTFGDPRVREWARDKVAIFDATNSTVKRRKWILEQCANQSGKPIGVVFVESICDDVELLEENYRFKINNSPDYAGMSEQEALEDLRNRVKKYEEAYETITDDSQSYIKVFNLSTKVLVNHIYGRMSKLIVPALMAWHVGTRPVYLCRPGQTPSGIVLDSEDYVSGYDKNDPNFVDKSLHSQKRLARGYRLGPAGKKFKERLFDFVATEGTDFLVQRASLMDMMPTGTSQSGLWPHHHNDPKETDEPPFPLRILASTMRRSAETVDFEGYEARTEQMSALNPLDKGDFVGMELEELQFSNPEWYESLERDPFHTRFPGGECYRDLIDRLGSVIIDIEQQVIPTLVVSHVSVLQTLMAYFRNSPVEKCTSLEVPLHTVIKFTPVRGGGWLETHHPLLAEPEDILPIVTSESEFSHLSHLSFNESQNITPQPIWGDHMKFRFSPASPVAAGKQPVTATEP